MAASMKARLGLVALAAVVAAGLLGASLGDRPARAAFPGQVSRIVYQEIGEGHDAGIYVLGADGHGRRPLADGPQFDARPAYSPDGRAVVFEREVMPDESGFDI